MAGNLFEMVKFTHNLQYWNGNLTTNITIGQYNGLGLAANMHVGDEVFITGLANPLNNGIKTITEIVDGNTFNVAEAMDVANDLGVPASFKEQQSTGWMKVEGYDIIVGIQNASEDAYIILYWSADRGLSGTNLNEKNFVASGVPALFGMSMAAPYLKITLRNEVTSQTSVHIVLYAQEIPLY